MTRPTDRRRFLASSAAVASVSLAGAIGLPGREISARPEDAPARAEHYELRTYSIPEKAEHAIVAGYLERALIPALGRLGVDRVGAFTRAETNDETADLSIDVLIPYSSLDTLAELSSRLFGDAAYREAAAEYFARPPKKPAYARVQSRLMKAFSGMPVIELPEVSRNRRARIFELRIYESHNEDAAFRKVDMFNQGEIDIMRDVGLAPVFFGETLISDDVPNLTYMLSGPDLETHRAHWKAFGAHPEWTRMKKIEKYKGTVSKISNRFLVPTAYSQI